MLQNRQIKRPASNLHSRTIDRVFIEQLLCSLRVTCHRDSTLLFYERFRNTGDIPV